MEQSRKQVRPHEGADGRLATRSGWTRLFATGGALGVAAGLVLVIGPDRSPELSWIARSFAELGILSGTILVGGVLCLLLAMLSHQIQRMSGQIRTAEETVHHTQALGLGMRQLVDRISLLHVELDELKEGQRAHLHMAQEQTSARTSGMQVDATYRLAASMDQLGRRIEDRMESQESSFEGRFLDLLGSISATHEELRGLVEQAPEPFETEDLFDDLLDGPPADFPTALDATPSLPEEDDGTELELFLELEEEPEPNPDAPDILSFDWNGIVLPERGREDADLDDELSLFDELDRKSDVSAPGEDIGQSDVELFSPRALEEAWKAFKRRTTEE